MIANAFSTEISYSENNRGLASFDISMPIDATGFTLHGKNLKGGDVQFSDQGNYVAPLLAHETGDFELPTSISSDNKPLIKTTINYNAIKFINPNGVSNFFIKIGVAARTEKVSGLDPFVLKSGTYTWQVPIFSVGTESDDVNNKSENKQFIEVGTGNSPEKHNGMYTQQFYLYTQGNGNNSIAEHPQKTDESNMILKKTYTTQFTCHADGVWGAGGSDPYRTITGKCNGTVMTFPAGPNLDYEYGTFILQTVHSPWTSTKEDHCVINKKQHAGCTNITIASQFHYIAQKIRVPINKNLNLYAEFGTAYRSITPKNLRYQCKDNVYLKNILPETDCYKKSYLSGGASYTYFAVGYAFTAKNGTRYVAQYSYIPEQENANRLQWADASGTTIYAISTSKKESREAIQKNLNDALNEIKKMPAVYNILGKHFFAEILKKNNIVTPA
ncbi:MAG: hypothetical protein A3E81_04505 [Gammaproteobacteria bacterium RIFCSPHIGHO2_12_FULL_36_30]|nr:MAG: hypothetical protein A3E81_04505 [Gammaproteobacteria bacterium RIFCSPHIGHO2_12_FULL_36_30]